MKAIWFSITLSLCLASFFVQATEQSIQPINSISVTRTKSVPPIKKIHLNDAGVKALTHSIRGIGIKRAEAIVNYRNLHGSFKSLYDLAQVKGLGINFVKKRLVQMQEVFDLE